MTTITTRAPWGVHIAAILDAVRRQQNLSYAGLSARTGIPQTTLRGRLQGGAGLFTFGEHVKVSEALGVDALAVLKDAAKAVEVTR